MAWDKISKKAQAKGHVALFGPDGATTKKQGRTVANDTTRGVRSDKDGHERKADAKAGKNEKAIRQNKKKK